MEIREFGKWGIGGLAYLMGNELAQGKFIAQGEFYIGCMEDYWHKLLTVSFLWLVFEGQNTDVSRGGEVYLFVAFFLSSAMAWSMTSFNSKSSLSSKFFVLRSSPFLV